MYQFSKRVVTFVTSLAILSTCATTGAFAQTGGTQKYASKVLYALDQAELRSVNTNYADDVIKASDDNYSNVEVLGVTPGVRAWDDLYYDGGDKGANGSGSIASHNTTMFLTAGNLGGSEVAVRNITYKVTSSNPNGFEQLDISFLGRVDARASSEVEPFLAVQGSDTVPVGSFGEQGYFDSFTDLRRITESEPVAEGTPITVNRDGSTPDYYNFGETISLTDEVRGKSEYYINFSYVSEELLSTAFTDISFAEKVPVAFSDTDKYEDYVMANADCSNNTNRNHLWTKDAMIQNTLVYLGMTTDYYEHGTVEYNGHPFIAWVDPANAKTGASGYSYYPQDWGFSSLTFKLKAPTGRKIQGLTIDYDGNLSITESAGKRSAASITTYVGDSASELGVAKRFMSYTDEDGNVVQNLGKDLDAFTVEGNGKDEIWVRLMIAGGDSVLATDGSGAYVRADNYINKIKITAHLKSNKVSQGTEITDENYAAKSLYALDMGALQNGKIAKSDDMAPGILASADNYSNAEVLGATSGLQFSICAVGSAGKGYGDSEWIPVLTAPTGTKNITYKITSANPNGFDELDISYLAGVNSANGSSYVTIQGSDEAPIGDFGSSDYYNTFGDIRKIVDTKPGATNTAPNVSKDYHDYGETLVLTDEVKGKKEYYVNFSINTENYMTAWLADIAFTEKIKTNFSDTDRYSTLTLTNMDYTGESANRGWIGYSWQTAANKPTGNDAIAATTENCVLVNAERWLMFNGDGTTNWLGFPDKNSDDAYTWTSGSFVLKLTAPEGKIFKGLNVELKGKNTIDACAGANMGTSITASVSDEFVAYTAPGNGYSYKTGMGAVKRFYSNTDANGVVKNNVGELTPFKVIGNNKSEMYLKITIGGGQAAWNHLTGMKIDGIFADKSVVDDIIFSDNDAFPTNGTLSAVYKLGSPETGEAMPSELTFILAVYKKVNGAEKLLAVNVETINNPTENTDYTVELTGLPEDDNSCCAKAFVWSDISGKMIPISNVYKLATE